MDEIEVEFVNNPFLTVPGDRRSFFQGHADDPYPGTVRVPLKTVYSGTGALVNRKRIVGAMQRQIATHGPTGSADPRIWPMPPGGHAVRYGTVVPYPSPVGYAGHAPVMSPGTTKVY